MSHHHKANEVCMIGGAAIGLLTAALMPQPGAHRDVVVVEGELDLRLAALVKKASEELGRLRRENAALRAENAQLRSVITTARGKA